MALAVRRKGIIKAEFGPHGEPPLPTRILSTIGRWSVTQLFVHGVPKNRRRQMFSSLISQESPQELGSTKGRYLGKRLATSLHTE